jgi:hypothetical protein
VYEFALLHRNNNNFLAAHGSRSSLWLRRCWIASMRSPLQDARRKAVGEGRETRIFQRKETRERKDGRKRGGKSCLRKRYANVATVARDMPLVTMKQESTSSLRDDARWSATGKRLGWTLASRFVLYLFLESGFGSQRDTIWKRLTLTPCHRRN